MVRDDIVKVVTVGTSSTSLETRGHLQPDLTVQLIIIPSPTSGSHGTTFGGNVLSTRLAHHVLTRLSDVEFLSTLANTNQSLSNLLSRLPTLFPSLIPTSVRGRGFILGIPFAHPDMPGRFVELARERGLLLLTAGTDCVRILPSLNVSKEECEKAVKVMESVGVVMMQEGWTKEGRGTAAV